MYCMYLRKSRADLEAEARGEGETLARHLDTLTRLAARLNLDVPPDGIYREIVSGDTIAARPMMQRLLSEVQAGKWEGVLCTEVERLARGDTIDQGMVARAFKYSNTKIITPAKTYDPANDMDEEYFEFSLFMARREYKAITRRMQAGRAASVREGHYVGGKRPFGYEVVKAPRGKGCTLKKIPEEAAVVRQAYDWYLYHNLGASAIANRLNAMGSATYNGHAWNAGSVRHMLMLPVYAGFVQWLKREEKKGFDPSGDVSIKRPLSDRYILAKGLHDPIVTEEEYRLVRERAVSRRRIAHVQNHHIANPLAGLVKCGFCGYAMVRRNNNRGVFLSCRSSGCACSSAYLDDVITAILDTLRAWVEKYSGVSAAQSAPAAPARSSFKSAAAIAHASIDQAQRQISAAQDMLERGVYTVEEYFERRHILQAKIAAAQAELNRIAQEEAAQPPVSQETLIIRALPQIRRVLDSWPLTQSPADQNALLRTIFSRIDYSKSRPLLKNESPKNSIVLQFHLLHFDDTSM